jgi:tetratricopeptide (TPR) repeat protein
LSCPMQPMLFTEEVAVYSRIWLVAISVVGLTGAEGAQTTPAENASFRDASIGTSQTSQASRAPITVTAEVRGDIFMAKKMYREAAEAYKEGPKDSAVLLNKTGIAYHQTLDLVTAEKYYHLSIRANPHYAEAINNLGTIYYARKSYRRAVNEYKKALRIHPQSASVLSNLGTGYFARKDYKRAAETWEAALAIDPEVFEARGTQGVILQERSVDERSKFHFMMAEQYAKKGMNDRALQYIRKALEEGYKEKKKIAEDPAFVALKDLPEFKELIASEQRVL